VAFLPDVVNLLLQLGLLLALLLNPWAAAIPARPDMKPADVKITSSATEPGGFVPKQYMMVDGKPFFPVGVSYHFTQHKDSWDRDLQTMRGLGLNAVRIDLSWRDVAPILPWSYQFSDLDDFLDKAARHGLYVVLVFSHTTSDYNTPLWFWLWNSNWRVVDQTGKVPLTDTPSINHPTYRRQLEDYVEATVRHVKEHPAILAYQLLNEPRYDSTRLYDYNPYSVAAFQSWLQQKYGRPEKLNLSWSASYLSFEDVQPPQDVPSDVSKPAQGKPWTDWRQFGYDNLASFVGDLARSAKKADSEHPVIVSEMAWWWWGEQPFTGVSPLHIYRDADIVGYDLYPDSIEDASYFLLTSDMLARYWNKPVWVMELNSKDGDPTGEEIQKFVSQALEGGASGIFYFQWQDTPLDGGSYGLLDPNGGRKPQYGGLAATVRWLKGQGETMMAAAQPKPDLYLVWPSSAVGEEVGSGSPAWELYLMARRITDGGLRIGLVAEDLIQAVDPQKLLSLRDGQLEIGKGPVLPLNPSIRGPLITDP
jgi:hypothetical protein